jgi:hypothetical protein
VTLCSLADGCQRFGPEDGDDTFLRNAGNHAHELSASQPKHRNSDSGPSLLSQCCDCHQLDGRGRTLLLATLSSSALWLAISGGSPTGGKEADHYFSSKIEVQNAWSLSQLQILRNGMVQGLLQIYDECMAAR